MLMIEVEQPVLLLRLLPIFPRKLKFLAQDALRDPQLCEYIIDVHGLLGSGVHLAEDADFRVADAAATSPGHPLVSVADPASRLAAP